jgi:hypothetical protein
MSPRSSDLIRPLLEMSRASTEAFCKRQGLAPREDVTNLDPAYTRNRIRHELMPLLATYQPRITATLARNATIIARDRAFLESQTDSAWQIVVTAAPDMLTIDREKLRGLDDALRWRVLRRACLAAGSTKPDAHLDADSVARLERVACDRSGEQRRVQLSTGVEVVIARQMVMIPLPTGNLAKD